MVILTEQVGQKLAKNQVRMPKTPQFSGFDNKLRAVVQNAKKNLKLSVWTKTEQKVF